MRVANAALDALFEHAEAFTIEVRTADMDGATAALVATRSELVALAGSAREADSSTRAGGPGGLGGEPPDPLVTRVVIGPRGPLLRGTNLRLGDELIESIPDRVVRHLEAAGVLDALVDVPTEDPLDQIDATPSAVVLRVFPAPGTPVPGEWLDLASDWVLGDHRPTDTVRLRLLGVSYSVAVADAGAHLHEANRARAWCDLAAGRPDDRLRTASLTFGRAPHLALAAGGPGCDDHALLARFDLLADVARDLASGIAYACMDFEDTFAAIGLGLANDGWRSRGGANPNLVAGALGDVAVPDGFAFQVLGKGHLARFGDPGDPPIGVPLAEGRVEVALGDPADWLAGGDARAAAQAEAIAVLAPALLDEAGADALVALRPPVDHGAGLEEPGAAVALDLDEIVLEASPHPRRGRRLTLLELAAWLGHEPHSDAPASVSPVLATFGRWLAAGLGHDERQELQDAGSRPGRHRPRRRLGSRRPSYRGRPAERRARPGLGGGGLAGAGPGARVAASGRHGRGGRPAGEPRAPQIRAGPRSGGRDHRLGSDDRQQADRPDARHLLGREQRACR